MPSSSPSRSRLLFWLVLMVWGVTISCQTPGNTGSSHLTRETISLDFLKNHLIERQSGITELKSFVNTSIKGKNFNHSFRQSIIVGGNDSLRLDTYNVFGQILGIFMIQGSQTLLYDPGRNRIISGRKVENYLMKTIGMNLNFKDDIGVFLGNVPRSETLDLTGGRLDHENNVYQLTAVDPQIEGEIEIRLNAYTLLPEKMIRSVQGKPTYEVTWENYQKIGNLDFPHNLTIHLPLREETVLLKYDSPAINQGLPDDAFQLFS